MRNFYRKKNLRYRKYYAKYVCNKWNNSSDLPKLVDIGVYFIIEKNLSDYRVKDPKLRKVYGYQCIADKSKK